MSTIFSITQRSYRLRPSTLRSTSSVVLPTSLECVAMPVTDGFNGRNAWATGAHKQGPLAWRPSV